MQNGFSPYEAETQDIEQRRKYAELLRQQGMAPLQAHSVGGMNARISPLEGLAKMLNAYSGSKGVENAAQERKDLMGRMDTERSTDMAALLKAYGGTPARPQVMGSDDMSMLADQGGEANPMTQAVPGDPNQAAMIAMNSRLPDVKQYAMPLINMAEGRANRQEDRSFRGEQAQAQREFQMEQLRMRAEDQRASAQERAAAQRQLVQMQIDAKRDMAAMVAANRPTPNPVQVMGLDGKPVYVSAADAVGRQPVSQSQSKPMSSTAQKELIETDEQVQGSVSALDLIRQAKALNDKAMGFTGAGAVASVGTLLPESVRPDSVDATKNLDNILQSGALPQLKAIFGGMPTEGERKILLDVQGSSSQPPKVRKEIFDRAEKAINARLKFAQEKTKALREGTYFSGDGGISPTNAPTGPKPGEVIKGFRFKGGNPADKNSWEPV
jgi:hypothetical protein